MCHIWASSWQNQQNDSAPSEDSDQPGHSAILISLRCPHEQSLGQYLPTERTAKTLIRLGGYPGWSESSQGAYTRLLVLSWSGSLSLSVGRVWFYNSVIWLGALTTQPRGCLREHWGVVTFKYQRTSGPVNAHLTPGPGIYINAFIHVHVYSPRAGADNPLGTNVDVNRKPLSFRPFVASFKQISLNSDFIHIF